MESRARKEDQLEAALSFFLIARGIKLHQQAESQLIPNIIKTVDPRTVFPPGRHKTVDSLKHLVVRKHKNGANRKRLRFDFACRPKGGPIVLRVRLATPTTKN